MSTGILLYLLIINLLSFCLFGIDKRRAMNNMWRIPEKTLLLSAAAGGAVGALWGMRFFRHKTRKPLFSKGIPILLIAWCYLIYRYFQ